jgi:hypothetical protein
MGYEWTRTLPLMLPKISKTVIPASSISKRSDPGGVLSMCRSTLLSYKG